MRSKILIILALIVQISLSGCMLLEPIVVAPVMVVTSPKLLFFKLKRSYKKDITVDFLVDGKLYQMTATISCINKGGYFNGASYSWEPEWDIKLSSKNNNQIEINGKKYEMMYGGPYLKKIYPNKKNVYGCSHLLEDQEAIKMANDNNSLLFESEKKDGVFKNKFNDFIFFRDFERGKKWLSEDKKSRSEKTYFEAAFPDNIKIKSFYIK